MPQFDEDISAWVTTVEPVTATEVMTRARKKQQRNRQSMLAATCALLIVIGAIAVMAQRGDPGGEDRVAVPPPTDSVPVAGDPVAPDGDPAVPPSMTYPDDGEDRHPHVPPQEPPFEIPPDFGAEPEYLGMSEEQARMTAEDEGLLFRVVWRDGVHLGVRSDRRADRISVHIEDGHVVEAVRG